MTTAPEPEAAGGQQAEAAPAAADAAADLDQDLDALLADVTRERDEYLDLAQRAKADFENYRKRAARESAEARAARQGGAGARADALDRQPRAGAERGRGGL